MAAMKGRVHVTSDTTEHVDSFWQRYEHTKAQDVLKNVLLEDVITRYENLVLKHNDYVREHESERERAQTWVRREQELTGGVRHLQHLLNRDPFILVLIDGDELVFNSTFLSDGGSGGKKAASFLNSAVQHWAAENIIDCGDHVKVVVRVYANLKALAEICTKAGLVTAPSQLENFARGFTGGETLFDFVDIGYSQERPDRKIADSFRLFLYDYHCRQIVVGCADEAVYARLLEQYVNDEEALTRVTILEAVPFENELAILPFPIKKFTGVFQESKVTTSQGHLRTGILQQRTNSSQMDDNDDLFTPSTSTPLGSASSPGDLIPQLDGQLLTQRLPHLRGTSLTSSANSSESGMNSNSWASITKASAPLPFTDKQLTASPEKDKPREVLRNIKGQRVDEPMEYNRSEFNKLKKLKVCNHHYIGTKGCWHYKSGKPEKCLHRHDLKLSKQEIHSLRAVTRETPCKDGLDCDDIDCIYGHRCPFPIVTERGTRGSGMCTNGDNCRFPRAMHGIDTKVVKTIKIGGIF